MEDYSEVCTNSYRTEAFDRSDARSFDPRRGTLHGEVKIYTQDEIAKFNLDREDGLI